MRKSTFCDASDCLVFQVQIDFVLTWLGGWRDISAHCFVGGLCSACLWNIFFYQFGKKNY